MNETTNLELAQDLLGHLNTFLKNESSGSWPHDFGNYLATLSEPPDDSDPVSLGASLVALANLVRRQASRALRDSPFTTIMDYQFLYVLRSHGPMSKSALIGANGMETSSGTEVIKRILLEGWIREEPNPVDGRSILVHITERGERVESENRAHVSEFYASLSKPLRVEQKARLFQLLHALANTTA